MPLINMKKILNDAAKEGRGVGSFSVANLEMVKAVIAAAEEVRTPVILQVAQVRLNTSPLKLIGPMMLSAAHNAKIEVAVHLDHGLDFATIKEALDLGFTSIMFDGSELSMEENIARTREAVALAHAYGADTEAEIGRVGRSESGEASPLAYADPALALRFIDETGVDALAVGIGNSHGVYTQAPVLRFDILEKISASRPTPLVLHGGTGLSLSDYKRSILSGIRKINIATAGFQAAYNAARKPENRNIFDISASMTSATQAVTLEHLKIFGLKGENN